MIAFYAWLLSPPTEIARRYGCGLETCVDGLFDARAMVQFGAAVGCGHVCGLLMRFMTAGPDAIRGLAPNQFGARGEPEGGAGIDPPLSSYRPAAAKMPNSMAKAQFAALFGQRFTRAMA